MTRTDSNLPGPANRQPWRRLVGAVAAGAVLLPGLAGRAAEPERAASPVELYNRGTAKLREKKLREAEGFLQTAVAAQNDDIQPPALYNLGHVRFQQGVEELKKGPDAEGARSGAKQAGERGDAALSAAEAALAGEDLQAIVGAYMQGRGARKELKAATEAVKHALESKALVLSKWQRASGDFKSAAELRPADPDAPANAQVVDRCIATLVDMQQMMMQGMAGMQKQRQELAQKMAQLRGKMPADMGQKMKGGDDDDDDDQGKKPKEPQDGQQEGPVKPGKEMTMSAEEAARMLDLLRLDKDRKLSLGGDEPGKPRNGKQRDW